MNQVSYWLVILSLVTSNIYIADSYTLSASLLNRYQYDFQTSSYYIADNRIDSIDPNTFNGYVDLKSITISSTILLAIDMEVFTNLTNLNYLKLDTPSLNTLTNSKSVKLPSLTSLTLFTNLTSLNKPMFNTFPALVWLYAANFNDRLSRIKTIDVHTFESLSNLTEINLRQNLLTGFEYLQIPKNLKTLNLAGNKMNYFALSRTMGVLDFLDISKNLFRSFKSMDFTFLANLTKLDLSYNPHVYPNEISGHMKPLVKLQYVYFNNLSINTIDSNFFKTNTKLKDIYLYYNKISSLDSGAFKGLNDLDSVMLDGNNLTKILSGTFNNSILRTIYLANNQISQLDECSFNGHPWINLGVDLRRNKLAKILPRTFCNNIPSIKLSYNQITEIENNTFEGASQIRYLDLSYNRIEKFAPGSFNNLFFASLDLSYNNLTELRNGSFVGYFSSLTLLGNKIEKIEEGTFNYAIVSGSIYLQYNNLTEIKNTTFAGQNQLEYIYLDNNKLSTIESGSFANMTSLRNVNLDNNQLTQLNSSMFVGSNKLEAIQVRGNPNLPKTNIQSLCPSAATLCKVYY